LIQENDCIVVEHLKLKEMSQKLHLGKSVMDAGYSSFINKLQCKALWNDKTVILANQWFASSKTCSSCGYIKKDLLLHEREWICPMCSTHHHRDQNAAVNLKIYGEKEIRSARSEFRPVEDYKNLASIALLNPLKQENVPSLLFV
jgi:putative transposase